ncbi:hypothetical protein [Roseibium litorale]|uniref:Uncharacterized protein n=1 Tax=Roseibium litorale TaxID=2803841 RepID=A0ABR9CRX2_9HYPH|nr:hypothetical protein [Roseibium litorale]MBD8893618.1 hypothetical protein [Roseibium litorale]
MKKTLALLAAATALTAVIGVSAYSSLLGPVSGGGNLAHLLSGADTEQAPVILAGGHDDERGNKRLRRGDDDHGRYGEHDDDDDDDDDDDGGNARGQSNPAPAGTVAPPKNGLFGTGTPKVQVN